MVPKIPIAPAGETNIGTDSNQSAFGLEAAKSFIEGPAQCALIRQVFEKVAAENNIEFGLGERPARRAILLDKTHFPRKMMARVGIQVHPELPLSLHGIDELAVAAAQIQNSAGLGHKALEKIGDQHLPDAPAILLHRRETIRINARQFRLVKLIHSVFCSRRN